MIDQFLDYLTFEKRYSPHTITSYRKDLQDFYDFVVRTESTKDLTLVTKKVVKNFILSLSQNEISKRSINRKLSSLKGFFHFLLKVGEIEQSPMDLIKPPKYNTVKQIPMSVDEMSIISDIMKIDDINLLSYSIIEVLYQTGIRKSELCNLKLSKVDLNEGIMRVIGKGNKERLIPFSKDLSNVLDQYLECRNPVDLYSDYFFVNKKGHKLTEKFVYLEVNKYLSMVTTKKKKSPHILRHSFATHVLNNGAEISSLKELLGHASLASTQVYTNANIEQLKKVFNQAHPRAIKKEEL